LHRGPRPKAKIGVLEGHFAVGIYLPVNGDGTPMERQETANPAISGFSKPSPIRWFERVSAASPVFAVFSPRFARCFRLAEMVNEYTF